MKESCENCYLVGSKGNVTGMEDHIVVSVANALSKQLAGWQPCNVVQINVQSEKKRQRKADCSLAVTKHAIINFFVKRKLFHPCIHFSHRFDRLNDDLKSSTAGIR